MRCAAMSFPELTIVYSDVVRCSAVSLQVRSGIVVQGMPAGMQWGRLYIKCANYHMCACGSELTDWSASPRASGLAAVVVGAMHRRSRWAALFIGDTVSGRIANAF